MFPFDSVTALEISLFSFYVCAVCVFKLHQVDDVKFRTESQVNITSFADVNCSVDLVIKSKRIC